MLHYCDKLGEALQSVENGEVVIDMDAVADAVDQAEKPDFYISDERQQRQFVCPHCGESNDILGRFGYCSACGTRNDFAELELDVGSLRERLKNGATPEQAVRDAVALFDSFVAQYAKQLAALVPMRKVRRERLTKQRFQNFGNVCHIFNEWFGVDLSEGMSDDDRDFVALRFHRRHVYEHNGGEADQKYIDDSGDTSVRVKQTIRESLEDAHRLLGLVLKAGRNLHEGFHEIIPPIAKPIDLHQEQLARRSARK